MKCQMCHLEVEDEKERYALVADMDGMRHAGSGDEWILCVACSERVLAFMRGWSERGGDPCAGCGR